MKSQNSDEAKDAKINALQQEVEAEKAKNINKELSENLLNKLIDMDAKLDTVKSSNDGSFKSFEARFDSLDVKLDSSSLDEKFTYINATCSSLDYQFELMKAGCCYKPYRQP